MGRPLTEVEHMRRAEAIRDVILFPQLRRQE